MLHLKLIDNNLTLLHYALFGHEGYKISSELFETAGSARVVAVLEGSNIYRRNAFFSFHAELCSSPWVPLPLLANCDRRKCLNISDPRPPVGRFKVGAREGVWAAMDIQVWIHI